MQVPAGRVLPQHAGARRADRGSYAWLIAGPSWWHMTRVNGSLAAPWSAPGYRHGAMRGVDLHVHLPTGDWVCGCVGHYLDSVERYFGTRPEPRSVEDLFALYERLDLGGALLGWDAQGREIPNAELAAICARSGGRFAGFGSVDPNRADALERLAAFPVLGLRGLRLHPTLQGFDPGDDRFLPFFDLA